MKNVLIEVTDLIQSTLNHFALKSPEGLKVLGALVNEDRPISMKELADKAGIANASTLTHIIDGLEKKGMVERVPWTRSLNIQGDRRTVLVHRTKSLTQKYKKWERTYGSKIQA